MGGKLIIKRTLRIVMWIAIGIVVLTAGLLASISLIFTPERLTSMAEKYANEYLVNSHTSVGKMEFTLWSSFPYASVEINDLSIISNVFKQLPDSVKAKELPAYSDSLVALDRFSVSLNLLKLLTGTIDVRDVMMSGLDANIVEYSPELVNYAITPTSEEPEPDSNEPLSLPDITINSFEISNCKGLNYYSRTDSMEVNMGINAAQLSSIRDKRLQLIMDLLANVKLDKVTAVKELPLYANSYIYWSADCPMHIVSDSTLIKVGEIPIKAKFDVDAQDSVKISSFTTTIGRANLTELLKYVDESYTASLKGYDGAVNAKADIKFTQPYVVAANRYPSMNVVIDIADSHLKGPRELVKFSLAANSDINGNNLDKSMVVLKELQINGSAIDLNISGEASNLISDPHVLGHVTGHSNIANMLRMINMPMAIEVNGNVTADTKFDIKMSDVTNQRYNRLGINGDLQVRNFKVKSEEDTIDLFTNYAKFYFGSREKYKNPKSDKVQNLIAAQLKADSVYLFYKGETIKLKNSAITAASATEMKQLANGKPLLPFGASIKSESMQYIQPDSSSVRLRDFDCKAMVTMPKDSGAVVPEIRLLIHSKRARYQTTEMRATVNNADIDINLYPRIRRMRQASAMSDSLRAVRMQQRANARRKNQINDSENLDLAIDSGTRNFLRHWQLLGRITTKNARVITPYFPQRNRLSNLDLTFSLDSFVVNNATLKSGRSKLDVNGSIHNIRSTIMGRTRKPLTVTLNVAADTFDINQLISTAYAGMAFASKNDSMDTESLMAKEDADLEEHIDNVASDSSAMAFIIPSNLEVDVNVYANYGRYADMNLQNIAGSMQIHDGALRLEDIQTQSDMGDINFNALYAAKNKQKIRFAFDLGLQNIKIDRFVKLIPEIDSIMPLLNSMDGIVDADIAASTDVDSVMNVIFPTLTAAVKLHGDSLVLFDSETFATISKWLMFKNKKRNLIDNMDVELLVADNKLELFPFIFEMDRYKVGIMGSNDLDLNLNYHISVLKSPIPFKFGLNITGNVDKMKYRLGKARFKEGMAGSVTSIVSDTRINLRDQISKAFRRGADAAINSQVEVARRDSMPAIDDALTAEDSVKMIEQGLIEAPAPITPEEKKQQEKEAKRKEKEQKKREKEARNTKKENDNATKEE